MIPKPVRRVLEMSRGERALVGMHAFKVDRQSGALFLNNATRINEPDRVIRTVELYLDEDGNFHVDWKHQRYRFKPTQVDEMSNWEQIGTTKDGYRMVPIASVVNWPEQEARESEGD